MADQQPDLFNHREVPLATVSLKPLHLGKWHFTILAVLARYDGLTDEGLYLHTNHLPNTIRPRRKELADHLYIETHDKGPLPSGRLGARWHLTERGTEALAAHEQEAP